MTDRHTNPLRQYMLLGTVIILIVVTLCGCSAKPKNFTQGDLTITLTESFINGSSANFDIYLSSDDVVFTAVEEKADELEYAGYEISSLNDYCMEILDLNKTSKDALVQRNDYYYFTNSKTVSGANYTYVHCMFNGNSSYWICEFVCKTKDFKHLDEKILNWADTIVIR